MRVRGRCPKCGTKIETRIHPTVERIFAWVNELFGTVKHGVQYDRRGISRWRFFE